MSWSMTSGRRISSFVSGASTSLKGVFDDSAFLRSFAGESRRMNPYEPPAGTIDETDETVMVTPLLTSRPAAKPLRSFVIAVFGALLAAGPYFGIAPVRTILCAGAFGMAVVWLERIFRYKS